MSDLSKLSEARDWLNSWIRESSPATALRTVERAVEEQTANLRSMESRPGRYPEKEIAEYRSAVALLQKSIPRLRREAAKADAAHAAKQAEAQAASDAARQKILDTTFVHKGRVYRKE